MAKRDSRPKRWYAAIEEARAALGQVETAAETLTEKLLVLEDIRAEYEDWQSNLPENLAQSALGEKLDAIAGLNLEWDTNCPISDADDMLGECEAVDLPLGFGRD